MNSLASRFARVGKLTRSLEFVAIARDLWLPASAKYVGEPRFLCLSLRSRLNVEHDLLASRFAQGGRLTRSLEVVTIARALWLPAPPKYEG